VLAGLRITQVSEDEIFQRDWLHVPDRIEDRLVRAHKKDALFVGVALVDDFLVRRKGACFAAWSRQTPM
jgi:hypothetical protein